MSDGKVTAIRYREERPMDEAADVAADDARQAIIKAAVDAIMGAPTYEAWWEAGNQADIFDGFPIDSPSLRAEYEGQRDLAHQHVDEAIWVAAPLIEAQVRAQVVADIKAESYTTESTLGMRSPGTEQFMTAYEIAAEIASGGTV